MPNFAPASNDVKKKLSKDKIYPPMTIRKKNDQDKLNFKTMVTPQIKLDENRFKNTLALVLFLVEAFGLEFDIYTKCFAN